MAIPEYNRGYQCAKRTCHLYSHLPNGCKDPMDPFQRYLGLVPTGQPLSHYELVGVSIGESDPNVLKTALQRVALRLKQSDRNADPDGWKCVVERVKKAQSILLSPEANSRYYAELNSAPLDTASGEMRSRPVVATASKTADFLSDLTPMLPPGDPNAALNIALLDSSTAVATPPWFAPSEVRMQSLARELGDFSAGPPALTSVSMSVPGMTPGMSQRKATTRVKSSSLSRAMPLLLLFGGAFGVLGFGGYMLYSSQKKIELAQAETQNPAAPQPTQKPNPVDPIMGNLRPADANGNRTPRRGGLPGVNEEGTPVEPIQELPPVEKPTPPPSQEEMQPADSDMGENPADPAPAPTDPSKPEEPPMDDSKPTGNLGDLINTPNPDPAKPGENMASEDKPEAEPTPAQLKQFADAMTTARKQLAPRALERFEAAIAKAEPNAISAAQKKQLERLKTMGEAIKRYEETLLSVIASRSAGENIQVKNTVVGWVEGEENKFKVRVGGQTQSYTTTTAPLGLANALVDLSLSPDDPKTKLSKACVALLSTKVASREEVNTWLEEAVTAGLIDKDFRSVVDEKYEAGE